MTRVTTCVRLKPNLGRYIGHVINLGTYSKNWVGKYFVNISLLTHNTTHEVWSLDLWNGAKTFTIKPPHLLWKYVTLHSIYQILHFKHYKNINFENSYLIEILFKWNDSSFFFLNSIMYIITFIFFESLKSFEQKKKLNIVIQ